MKRIAITAILAMLVAGCTEPAEPDAIIEAPGMPTATTDGFTGFDLTSAPLENRAPEWTVSGTTDEPVQLIISVFDDAVVNTNIEPGNWTQSIPLDGYGWNTIVIDAEAATGSVAFELEVNAFAPAVVAVNYGPAGPEPVHDELWVDLVNPAAAADYDGNERSRPEFANIHDVMVAWAAEFDHEVDYSYSSSFNSYGVDSIDGVGNALSAGAGPYWCYDVNGEAAGQGISLQRFQPGDEIAWSFCGT